YLSLGQNHHEIVLCPARQKALVHLGYQLKPHIAVADFARDVQAFGLAATVKSDSQPGIAELVEVAGPGGNVFQFYPTIETPAPGFKDTGASILRLGHVAVVTPEADKLYAFYADFLGFWYTDDIGGVARFMTCNREHHVVNIVGMPQSRLHHIAFELRGTAHHMAAADTLLKAGVTQLWGPARHTAGHNIAGYHYDPNAVMVELYTEMDVFIPDLGIQEPRPWHETNPMKPHSWGLDGMNAWGADFSFNFVTG
ncbi:MAG: glyoxalase/bleomycin resistance/extradiol dioxygenase family protein, partial [Rhizobiales bacterium 32-66-8]